MTAKRNRVMLSDNACPEVRKQSFSRTNVSVFVKGTTSDLAEHQAYVLASMVGGLNVIPGFVVQDRTGPKWCSVFHHELHNGHGGFNKYGSGGEVVDIGAWVDQDFGNLDDIARAAAFDWITCNIDRHVGNLGLD